VLVQMSLWGRNGAKNGGFGDFLRLASFTFSWTSCSSLKNLNQFCIDCNSWFDVIKTDLVMMK
jgi:hypothetical protein